MPDQCCCIRNDPLAWLKFHPVFALAQSRYDVIKTVQAFYIRAAMQLVRHH
jgi:hypothetical protein